MEKLDWQFLPMNKTHGKLIAVEGIDGSGKHTQVELLSNALRQRGYAVHKTGFPKYESFFGKMIGQFLDGKLGDLESVDPRFAALLYAGDRLEAKPELDAALHNREIVIADRYVASNLAHQGARCPKEKREEFIAWVRYLEYEIYGLPKENLVIYLRLSPMQSQKMVLQKAARNYTAATHDLLESNLLHLEGAAEVFDSLAKHAPWTTIQCFDSLRDDMRTPDAISAEILSAVECVLSQVHAKPGAH
jgi:dTMP kinase